jgi:hypothetical protein
VNFLFHLYYRVKLISFLVDDRSKTVQIIKLTSDSELTSLSRIVLLKRIVTQMGKKIVCLLLDTLVHSLVDRRPSLNPILTIWTPFTPSVTATVPWYVCWKRVNNHDDRNEYFSKPRSENLLKFILKVLITMRLAQALLPFILLLSLNYEFVNADCPCLPVNRVKVLKCTNMYRQDRVCWKRA